MKFIIDAQLPRQIAQLLLLAGHDVIHTSETPMGNRTPDSLLNRISVNEQRILITKDSDFVNSFLLRHEPWKLWLVATGNIRNSELCSILAANMIRIIEGFEVHNFIEINQTEVIYHS